jgi:CO dehydrogenase nickel-insertion accessory protein CooC1
VVKDAVDAAGLNLAGCVQEDELISRYDTEGRPTVELPDDARSVQALDEIFEAILEK